MIIRRRSALIATVALGMVMSVNAAGTSAADVASWPMAGHDLQNTRSNPTQLKVSASNASRLASKFTYTTHGDVSATPSVVGTSVYFPDWGGYLNKIDSKTGALIWAKKLSSYGYNSSPDLVSRTTPAVVGNVLYIGDQGGGGASPQPGRVLAIDAKSGNLLWSTVINENPFTIVTQSPVVSNGTVYVGAASAEENAAAFIPGYVCCTFRGSFSALDAATGVEKWRTYLVPDNGGTTGGYSGAAVWGSTAAVEGNTVYFTTGNNYSVPASAKTCQTNGGTPSQCLAADDHVDAIVSVNATTGGIQWATGVQGFDDWIVSCIPGIAPNPCPTATPGPDFDFGSGPALYTATVAGSPKRMVGAGAKSGIFWSLDAATGAVVWSTEAGPGSTLGGIEWGSATDGTRIYIAEANAGFLAYPGNPSLPHTGSWAALNPATGAILWQTPDPSGYFDLGAVSTSNGVVYAGSMSGHMYAINAATGAVVKDIVGQGASNAGPAISNDGTLYWGNGYGRFGLGAPSTTFYAFSLDGK
ncbi:MAG: PQQ-binding-like beta-propeller repeat protein [Actinomycetota bacterium]